LYFTVSKADALLTNIISYGERLRLPALRKTKQGENDEASENRPFIYRFHEWNSRGFINSSVIKLQQEFLTEACYPMRISHFEPLLSTVSHFAVRGRFEQVLIFMAFVQLSLPCRHFQQK